MPSSPIFQRCVVNWTSIVLLSQVSTWMLASVVSTRSSGFPLMVKIFAHWSAWARGAAARASPTSIQMMCFTLNLLRNRDGHLSPELQTQIRKFGKHSSVTIGGYPAPNGQRDRDRPSAPASVLKMADTTIQRWPQTPLPDRFSALEETAPLPIIHRAATQMGKACETSPLSSCSQSSLLIAGNNAVEFPPPRLLMPSPQSSGYPSLAEMNPQSGPSSRDGAGPRGRKLSTSLE